MAKRRVLCILRSAALLLALAVATTAQAAPATSAAPRLDVKTWTLPNGLQVLLLEEHKAPIATVQVFYHVGSKDEHPGIRGIAHMFEHMMFKGTERVPPEAHARLLKEVGGVTNAFTTEDLTAYHDTVPPSYLGFALELEAERMRHLKLFPATVSSERDVVIEEKRLRIDNDPVGKALELFRATAYVKHPYQWTAIGTVEDLRRITVADCQKFYDTYYQPNNATLIVVGDVREAEVRRLVDQHFAKVPRGPEPPRPTAVEPPQTARRDKTLAVPVELPVVIGGYHLPPARHPDSAALEVLSGILSEGESSRMHQRLVRRDKLALAAGGVVQALEASGLFLVYAAHLPDRDQAKVRAGLLDEIARVRQDGVTAAELIKAKNQLAAGYIYRLETVDGIATQLGTAQCIEGDWRRFLDEAARTLAVTAADIKRVAGQYLTDGNLTTVSVRPPEVGGK
ncbi:MAG TPA: pitrilysin family protein [Polyangia bacterium]|nr:pitrilysin family protein [Polyangia bacterium]